MDPQRDQSFVAPLSSQYPSMNSSTILSIPQVQFKPVVRKTETSAFSNFFIFEEGTISISLQNTTMLGCLLVSGYLLGILYWECNNNPGECSWEGIVPIVPTISSIVCKPFIDRIWCIVTVFFTLAVFQHDVRAFYKKLHGKATPNQNDGVFLLGILASLSLPCIAYFDTHNYGVLHIVFTTIFFVTCGFYIFFLGGLLYQHIDQYPLDEQASIERTNKFRWIMLGSVVAYELVNWFGPDTHSSFYEWVLTLMYLNAVGIMRMTNKFYETVHEKVPVVQKQIIA